MQKYTSNKFFFKLLLFVLGVTIIYTYFALNSPIESVKFVSSVISGLLLGSLAFFLQWRTLENFQAQINDNVSLKRSKPKLISIRHNSDTFPSIIFPILFSFLAYLGDDILFGYDFGSHQLGNFSDLSSALIIVFLLGFMFDLLLSLVGVATEIVIQSEIHDLFLILVAFIFCSTAITISAIFFDNNVFLITAILSRMGFSIIMRRTKAIEMFWSQSVIVVSTLTMSILPTTAFLYRLI